MNVTPDSAAEVLRPYEGIETFEGFLGNLKMRVGKQGAWTQEDTLDLTSRDFAPSIIDFQWIVSEAVASKSLHDALKSTSLELDQISLVGILRCPFTKQFTVFLDQPLQAVMNDGGELRGSVPTGQTPRVLPNRNLVLSFYLLLNQDVPGNFPYPYRKGTWLDQRAISIRSQGPEAFEFEWKELTDQVRVEKKLHRNSVVYVEQRTGMHEADSFADCVDAFIDAEYQSVVDSLGSSPIGRLLQAQLVQDVVAESFLFTMQQLARQGTPNWVEIESQPVLGRLIKTLARNCASASVPMEPPGVLADLYTTPTRINEYLEDLFGLRKLARQSAKED